MLLLAAFGSSLPSDAQQRLHWRSGSIEATAPLRDLAPSKQRIVLQFWSLPDAKALEHLTSLGVTVHDYVPDNGYVVTIANKITRGQLQEAGVRTISTIPAEVMSDPIPKDARSIDAEIVYWSDASEEECATALRKTGATMVSASREFRNIRALVPTAKLAELIASGPVRYVSLAKTPVTANLNSRIQTRVNLVQATPWHNGSTNPYNYTGSGYWLGIWDAGTVFNHTDLGGRLFNMEGVPPHFHANHVAGTMVGDGAMSAADGHAPWSLAGGSPRASLRAWDFNNPWPEQNAAAGGLLASNNSWGYHPYFNNSWNYWVFAEYFYECQLADQIVRNSNMNIVVATHNLRGNQNPLNWNWKTLTPPSTAKNCIAVGAVVHNNPGTMASFSGFGPTLDNRIKPDICAVGTSVRSTWQFGDQGINANYRLMDGTSMATPMVTGSLPHIAKRMSQVFPVNVFTDTDVHIKAALLNTATDIRTVGPDHESGWGRMDLRKAVDSLRWFKTAYSGQNFDDFYTSNNDGAINNAQTQTFDLIVPNNGTVVKMMLVWADKEGSMFAGKRLINDLDLTVTLGSTTYRPWLVPSAGATAITGINTVDNVEQVRAVLNKGTYKVNVKGTVIPFPGQKYALHVTSPNNDALMIKRIVYNGGGGGTE
ncbi:MAG: hypothetical protein HONBIEJF_00219 [Fimbriimonadaceae bacterium]|nr:hypothetical protein [Fimbriimonadaceae bacterium]